MKLWTVDGEEVLSLPSMTTPGRLAFTVDGSRLAVSGADGATRMLVVSVDELYGIAMDRVSRRLTAEECDRYAIAGCPVP